MSIDTLLFVWKLEKYIHFKGKKTLAVECKCLNLGCVFNSVFTYINV